MKQTYFWKDFVLKCGQQRTTHYSRKITVFPTLVLERNQKFQNFYIFPLKTTNYFQNPTIANLELATLKVEKQIRSSRVVVFWENGHFCPFSLHKISFTLQHTFERKWSKSTKSSHFCFGCYSVFLQTRILTYISDYNLTIATNVF